MKYTDENKRCLACGVRGVDLHHVRARGMGGNHDPILDEPWNLMPICNPHHVKVHELGLRIFAEKFPGVRAWLKVYHWDFCPVLFKWKNPRERDLGKKKTA